MEAKDSNVIQIIPNKFNNIDSEFVPQAPLNTNARQTSPYYAMFTLTSDEEGKKLAAIKTFQGITMVEFKNTEFKGHDKLILDEIAVDHAYISYLTFKRDVFSMTNPATLLLGYRTGLVAYIGCNRKLLGLYNYDEKNKSTHSHKNQSVSLITTIPDSNGDEILVLFADSSVMKYQLTTKATNNQFVEKLKRFEQKISFKEHLNKFKHRQKTKHNICYGAEFKDSAPEFNFFYAYNDGFPLANPLAYYRFNHRTMTDMVVKKHSSFSRTIFRDSKQKDITVLAFVSLDGYLLIYNYQNMIPRLSYKSAFGGINSVCFSENCELVALGGQDDCITVLDLYSLKTLRCEGHKSFVSRAIFQVIPFKGASDELSQTRITRENYRDREETSESRHIRIIGGGMDSCLSFWEFDKNIFRQEKPPLLDERNLPIKLSQINMSDSIQIKPVVMAPTKDAVAWVEISENMLFIADYDGSIGVYNIKELESPALVKTRKASESSNESKTSYSRTTMSSMQRENSYTTNSRDEREQSNYRGSREDTYSRGGYSNNVGRSSGAPYSSLSGTLLNREDKDILSRRKNGF